MVHTSSLCQALTGDSVPEGASLATQLVLLLACSVTVLQCLGSTLCISQHCACNSQYR